MLDLALNSIIWGSVSLILILLVNYRVGQLLALRKPLNAQQAEDLENRMKEIQKQVDRLVLQRTFTDIDR